ncbi:hypothetical protein JCM30237_23940 [Halolamina litorea]|uniref:tRNA(Ile2) 2-agmatinylcytidine synthetase n=1 Tax=Halolamina litorea TaxID=1515593 RepID=A0ABD6BTQ0_9EURY|nr:hypothetical protein [Halolamina litorea]
MTTLLLAIDDTDSLDSDHGTGRVSRNLGAEIAAEHGISFEASVRQQFLVDPRVPYTTHNSAACLVFEATAPPVEAIIDDAGEHLVDVMADVADPGLCVAAPEDVPEAVVEFGQRATEEVLDKQEAYEVATDAGEELFLDEYGGTGDGVIGALAAVGLTAAGDDGRYIAYGDIREYGEKVTAGRLRSDGIEVRAVGEGDVADGATVYTHDWIRPERRGGGPVLPVVADGDGWKPGNLSE